MVDHTQNDDWAAREELAERMIPIIGRLYRQRGAVTSLHGHRIINLSATGLLGVHERVSQLGHEELAPAETLAVLTALEALEPGAASIDVGRLAVGARANPGARAD